MNNNTKKIFATGHFKFLDKIAYEKRIEITNIINREIKDLKLNDALDIGTTEDTDNKSSNTIIKNLEKVDIYKSISNQDINSSFFSKKLKKSITDNFTPSEIDEYSSDIVLSNATIEHVGNEENQRKMIDNIIILSKKIFVISTPNRYYPIDFHTKLPLIHWLPKTFHRNILNYIGLNFYSKEENLNLLSKEDLTLFMKKYKYKYNIRTIKLFNFTSNLILIGKKNNI